MNANRIPTTKIPHAINASVSGKPEKRIAIVHHKHKIRRKIDATIIPNIFIINFI
jgi:hypothetical protein